MSEMPHWISDLAGLFLIALLVNAFCSGWRESARDQFRSQCEAKWRKASRDVENNAK